jgi:4-amino-4-deoxy-L-arabinose transferase-like glycosyltransferase
MRRNEEARPARRGRLALLTAVGLLTLAGAALRISRLDHPMRYDESFTLLRYAFPPEPARWVDYSTPNNHVLHTLLVRMVVSLGGVTPPGVRLPALLAGVALVPVTAWLALRLTDRPPAAVCAAALVGGSSLLVEYSVNARGYSLLCLLTLGMALATLALGCRPRRWAPWVAWCLLAAAGAVIIPVMVYPAGILALLLAAHALLAGREKRRHILSRLPAAIVVAVVLSTVLYLPVFAVSGADSVLANRFVTPRPRGEVLAELPATAARTLADWGRDTSWAWRVLVGGGVAAAAVFGVARRRVLLLLPPVSGVLLLAAAMAHGVVPFPRVWMFLLPLSLVTAACGLSELAALPRSRRFRLAASGVVMLAVLAAAADAGARSLGRDYLVSEDPRTLVDAEGIIEALHAEGLADGRTALLSESPSWPPLAYYALLHAPDGFCSPADPRRRRAVAVVGPTQTLEGVLAANAPAASRFGHFQHWRDYPRATVYLASRASPR